MSDTSHCRSCGAVIIWAETEKGKSIPIDPTPTEDGNIRLVVREQPQSPIAIVVTKPENRDTDMFKSHFATCPNASKHRKAR
jgi:hypothetical protein